MIISIGWRDLDRTDDPQRRSDFHRNPGHVVRLVGLKDVILRIHLDLEPIKSMGNPLHIDVLPVEETVVVVRPSDGDSLGRRTAVAIDGTGRGQRELGSMNLRIHQAEAGLRALCDDGAHRATLEADPQSIGRPVLHVDMLVGRMVFEGTGRPFVSGSIIPENDLTHRLVDAGHHGSVPPYLDRAFSDIRGGGRKPEQDPFAVGNDIVIQQFHLPHDEVRQQVS